MQSQENTHFSDCRLPVWAQKTACQPSPQKKHVVDLSLSSRPEAGQLGWVAKNMSVGYGRSPTGGLPRYLEAIGKLSRCRQSSLLPSRACILYPARRVATLEAKQKPSPQSQGLSQQDQVIAERLARLRQENKPSEWGEAGWPERHSLELLGLGCSGPYPDLPMPIAESVPSQAEIEARLAALKDEPRGPITSIQEMETRLAALKGRVPPSQTPRPVSAMVWEGRDS